MDGTPPDRGARARVGGRVRGAIPALSSGVAAVGGATLVGGDWPGALIEAAAWTLLVAVPDAALAWGILTLTDLGRPLLAVGAGLCCVLAFAAVAAAAVRLAGGDRPSGGGRRGRADAVFGGGFGQAIVAFGLTIDPLIALAAGVCGGVTLALSGVDGTVSRPVPGRRRLLRAVGVAAGTLGIAWATASRPSPVPDDPLDDPGVDAMLAAAAERSFDLPGAEPLVSERFFQVDINTSTPVVEREDWRLWIDGPGPGSRLILDYDDLTAREAEHRFVTLRCVSDEVNGDLIDTALWTGVPIAPLLEEAGAPEECCVYVEAADGYYHAFPRAALERGFLAWRMNGRLLPRGHGHPVRALIPGHWGEINVKWITRIEIREEPATSYWQQHGWHGDGPVSTVAKVHSVAGTPDGDGLVVGGHAYAGTRGVSTVEVSVDGGDTWERATLSDPLPAAVRAAVPAVGEESIEGPGPDTVTGTSDVPQASDGGRPSGTAADAWRMWRYEYTADGPHDVVARAIEADGTTQPVAEADPFPEGASGWVRRRVDPERVR
ncbi:molybdopterin-dependent oxidoreductase [Halorubrum sp. JWXQ-INN 858]|uniref:molybdopterin-dependent oxidoreductase n=1 Tax=Halorubrum sp. JWXQ-INN 858 TaxID=2690782 RepID=UPI0013582DBA|nr:molybdopterin-dependent oxidoreductase [Halorubrum sp. JWXQ-INN 858]MWV64899.1 molybdopterin-dependent oxidoreductase [Halorubrum sp. JWXQ-INN 858]